MKNKIVVITGAGSGIGRALAEEFGALGARLALNDYIEEDLKETMDILQNMGFEKPLAAVFDVSSKPDMEEFASRVKTELGNSDIVINNAGISGADLPGYSIPEESYRKVMDVNFFGVLNGCQAFLPQMVEQNSGALVNISSVFGLSGFPNNSDYCAAKFAVRGYTESLAIEFHESPILIQCVHPGGINTRIARGGNNPKASKKLLVTSPNAMAKSIIDGIRKGTPKVVYGSGSSKIRIISNQLPRKVANGLIWKQAKSLLDMEPYRQFLK